MGNFTKLMYKSIFLQRFVRLALCRAELEIYFRSNTDQENVFRVLCMSVVQIYFILRMCTQLFLGDDEKIANTIAVRLSYITTK